MCSPPRRPSPRWCFLFVVGLAVTASTAHAEAAPAPAEVPALFANTARVVEDPVVAGAVSQVSRMLITAPRGNLVAPTPNPCASNTEDQLIKITIAGQHAWMCEKSKLVHESPVTTGATVLEMGTPTGTWHIVSKESDRFLEGADYYVHVDYWLQYDGDFGIHDSAWQQMPYGSPDYQTDGSHGCVHFPDSAMVWTFEWSRLGTTVAIEP